MPSFILFLLLYFLPKAEPAKPTISFTFDDGAIEDMPGYKLENWNKAILKHLENHHTKSILFSAGGNKLNSKGEQILSSWNQAGHKLANHTFSHQNFNNVEVSLNGFEKDFLKNHEIIKNYSNFYPYFRFPYLKEGNTVEKVRGFREVLKRNAYKNGHVSIDASDWYINGRLVKRLRENPKARIDGYKNFYLQHIEERAKYYDSLCYSITKRRIHHVLLLHHNLSSALFLGDLIKHFKSMGWAILDADKAYKDPIYNTEVDIVPAGESLIWSMAKKQGIKTLRYPAEDGAYEKEAMDRLGL